MKVALSRGHTLCRSKWIDGVNQIIDSLTVHMTVFSSWDNTGSKLSALRFFNWHKFFSSCYSYIYIYIYCGIPTVKSQFLGVLFTCPILEIVGITSTDNLLLWGNVRVYITVYCLECYSC